MHLPKNISHLRKLKGLTQEQFADEIQITRSRVGSYEEGRSEPPIELLIKIADYFHVPVDILIRHNLSKTNDHSFIEIGSQRILFPIAVDDENRGLVEIVPTQASAGYLSGYDDPEYIEQLEKIQLPFLSEEKHRAFPIKGDSMLPLKEGSIVIGRFIEDLKTIKSGKTYIIVTANDGIVYKRVHQKKNDQIILSSDNKKYVPYPICTSEILELWEFSCSIHREEYDGQELRMSSIQQLLEELKEEVGLL